MAKSNPKVFQPPHSSTVYIYIYNAMYILHDIYIYILYRYTSSTRTRRGGSCLKDIYKIFLIYRTCMRRAPAKPVRACTLRKSHLKLHFALHTSPCTLHTPQCTLLTSHCTLPNPHFTLHTPHFTFHTSQSTLHSPHFTLLTASFTLQTSHCILHAPHFTLHSSHPTLHLI